MILPRPTRRQMLATATLLASGAGVLGPGSAAARAPRMGMPPTQARWIDGAPPARHEGVTWGVPWPRGLHGRRTAFSAASPDGQAVPVQTWPLAYWPDGSLKWTAHAVAAQDGAPDHLTLTPGRPVAPDQPVSVRETADQVEVVSGPRVWRIPRRGPSLIAAVASNGREILRDVHLVALRQDQPDFEEAAAARRQSFVSDLTAVVVEQTGPVRAVVRLEGRHGGEGRAWLPFTVRLYFHAGSEAVRLVHSVVFDGDETTDFIAGLGVRATVPMRDALHDRHVRLAGEGDGLWAEAVRPLTGLRRDPGEAFRKAQIDGRAVPALDGMAATVRDRLALIPAWGNFTLVQPTPDGFEIRKRTKAGHGWIHAASGRRAGGLAFVGGPTGGAALGLAHFWQAGPNQLDIRDAAGEAAELTAWLWSPDAKPMDMRAYHDGLGMETHAQEISGLEITYEDYEKGYAKPVGVARTSELTLWALEATPSRERFGQMADVVRAPPRLACSPERLHAAGVFGDWGLPDRSTPARAAIEQRAGQLLDFYLGQVDQRGWYGFWNYGDVMHSYDFDRHEWKYDIGGFAWANSELSPDLWLWYSFLRTGRADVFRMAEAMTRHTGEVDVYHLGPWKGFGTRHGVQHWSDSSKQPRVSTAAYRRIYYYLTADERVGDLMRDLVGSDETLTRVDIGRKLAGAAEASASPERLSVGFGTTWSSFLAAWLTEWERTGDTRWRDRILAGMNSIPDLPMRWFAGGALYDLRTGRFVGGGDKVSISHLNAVFGAVEIHSELLKLVRAPRYEAAWIEYCKYYNAPPAELAAHLGLPAGALGGGRQGRGLRQAHSRLTAYAANRLGDPALARRAWREFSGQGTLESLDLSAEIVRVAPPAVLNPVDEAATVSTNGVSQWGLAAYQNLALIPDALEAAMG
jgi:hypothetical protein